jgi:hypothetical protein
MASVTGEVVIDGFFASASSFVVNLPLDMQIGEIVILDCVVGDLAKTFSATDWTVLHIGMSTSNRELIWRVVDGTEGTTVTVNVSSGTSSAHFVQFRMSGLDTTDPFNSNNAVYFLSALTTTPSFPVNTITVNSGNGCLVHLSCEATRTVTDYDVSTLDELSMSAGDISNHIYLDVTIPGFGNPQYDFTLADSRTYDMVLVELKEEADPSLTAESGAFVVTGFDANLGAPFLSEGGNAWFNSTNWGAPSFGDPSTWWNALPNFNLQLDTGLFTVTGFPATFVTTGEPVTIGCDTGTFTVTGFDAEFAITPVVPEEGDEITAGSGYPVVVLGKKTKKRIRKKVKREVDKITDKRPTTLEIIRASKESIAKIVSASLSQEIKTDKISTKKKQEIKREIESFYTEKNL